MDLGLSGKSALVLGSSQGLGFACASALAGEGARVVINGRHGQALEDAANQMGNGVQFVVGDVARPNERQRLLDEARSIVGTIDILVTNAGGPPPGPMDDHARAAWLSAIETNMLSAIDFARLCLPDMVAAGFGRIVNITSFSVREPYPNMGLATAARAGLTGAMSSLAVEVAGRGITVNNLLPGLMDTGALQRVYRAQARDQQISEAAAKEQMARSVPMGRLGRAEDFGPACAFLCSPQAAYITGQNITIDGGLVRALI